MSAAAITMVEKRLAEVDQEITSKVGDILTERDELTEALKKLKRGSKVAGEAPATSDQELIETVGKLATNGNKVNSSQIAGELGVDVRTISRRLAKLAGTGVIVGNKDEGYSGS